MMGKEWLIDDFKAIDEGATRQLERKLTTDRTMGWRGAQEAPYLAVRLQDIIIHDTKKWFGEANIRIDALVVHGHGTKDKPESFYMPQTFRFPRVVDGDTLPTGEAGLLIFYGKPFHFLNIYIIVSRDRKDSDDLSNLLSKELRSRKTQGAVGTLLGLAVAAPQVAIVTAAIGAAAQLGKFAYQILSKVTGSTVGLYRTSWLQYRDRFGIGRHPEEGSRKEKDFSFWYEIILDKPPDGA